MDHYIAYHSVERMGREYTPSTHVVFQTNRPEKIVRGAIGAKVWIIVGNRVARRMQYRLAGVYIPTEMKRDGELWFTAGPGTSLRPQLDVTITLMSQ